MGSCAEEAALRSTFRPPHPDQVSPEFALLLACASACSGLGSTARLRELAQAQGLDWEIFLALAEEHALRPLVYRQLEGFAEALPPPINQQLQRAVQASAHNSLRLTLELLRIVHLLGEREIRVIAYKGPVLSQAAYDDLAARECYDLDILVPAVQVPAAKAGLVEAGYRPTPTLTPQQEAALLHSNCEYALVDIDRQACVELHWQIAPSQFAIEFDVEGLWTRSQTIVLGNTEVRTFSDEDMLLVLSVHAAKHLWHSLGWLCDLAALMRKKRGLAWTTILAEAQRLGALRILLISLHLCQKLLGTELPPAVSEKILADREVTDVAKTVIAKMQTDSDIDFSSLRAHRLWLRTRSRWRDKSRYAWRLLFTPGVSEWSFLALPAALTLLYPVIRLGRIAGKVLRGPEQRPAKRTPAPTPLDEPLPPAHS